MRALFQFMQITRASEKDVCNLETHYEVTCKILISQNKKVRQTLVMIKMS